MQLAAKDQLTRRVLTDLGILLQFIMHGWQALNNHTEAVQQWIKDQIFRASGGNFLLEPNMRGRKIRTHAIAAASA